MKLPGISFFANKEKPQYFLALLLRDENASAVIIEELQGRIKIIGEHHESFKTTVEDASEEELLEVLDKCISTAEERLPANIQTEKTVFGVKDTWVEEKHIKKEYLLKLKKLCESLTLTPIGFLIISEAIAHLIQREEGAPISAILCEIGKKHLALSLFRAGKIIETKLAPIEESVPKTADSLLKSFTSADVLPSRIIIFNQETDERLSQQLITHQWSKSIPFLHMPQISLLPPGFAAKAMVVGAADQMGFEVPPSLVDTTEHEIKAITVRDSEEKEDGVVGERVEKEHIHRRIDTDYSEKENFIEDAPKSMSPEASSTFGFMLDKDIALETQADTSSKEQVGDAKITSDENGQEEVSSDGLPQRGKNAFSEETHENLIKVEEELPTRRQQKNSKLNGMKSLLIFPLSIVSKLPFHIMSPMSLFSRGGNKFLLIPPLLLILLIAGTLLYVFKLGATVELQVKTKDVTQEENISFVIDGSNDFSNNRIAAKKTSISLNGTVSADVTGKKEVGNKAKGAVTLFNSSDGKITLNQGTLITSSSDLDFELDKEVSIASASGDIFTGKKSGTAQVSVTAAKIGKEYNLPSDTKFTVGKSTVLAAKNESAFAGGSKKEVTVVSKKDTDKLLTDLPKSLEKKADEEMQKKLGNADTLLPQFIEVTLDNTDFNKKVDDEAKNVTLTADVTFEAVSYLTTDMTEFAKVILKERYGGDESIAQGSINASITNAKEAGDEVTASLIIKAGLLPKLDNQKLVENLQGQSFDSAKEILEELPQVEDVNIVLSPNLPFLPQMLPRINKNIHVVIKTNE